MESRKENIWKICVLQIEVQCTMFHELCEAESVLRSW